MDPMEMNVIKIEVVPIKDSSCDYDEVRAFYLCKAMKEDFIKHIKNIDAIVIKHVWYSYGVKDVVTDQFDMYGMSALDFTRRLAVSPDNRNMKQVIETLEEMKKKLTIQKSENEELTAELFSKK